MPDGYMDAAAVPVPDAGDDAFALNLHGELANHRLTTPVQCACGWREPDTEDRTWSRHVRDALLPLIRDHIAAAVQGERGRAAVAVEELPGPNGEGVAKWPKQHADVYMLAIEEAAAHIRALNDREADDDRR